MVSPLLVLTFSLLSPSQTPVLPCYKLVTDLPAVPASLEGMRPSYGKGTLEQGWALTYLSDLQGP